MPLVGFEVRNEYGLGQLELYRNVDREDPKAVLDGIAAAGLVGILRQLGDLTDFAAELFHGIQEEVMTTASRCNKLMIRLQNIEAAVPSLEKSVFAQTSHIHFAYTAGQEWHPSIPNGQNHFICNDLPRFIMDSYEECRGPPRLHLLDKFDIDGPGSCWKRYSDPTYFRRVSGNQIVANKTIQKNKNRKAKRKQSSQRKKDVSRLASTADQTNGRQFTSLSVSGRTSSSSRIASTVKTGVKCGLEDRSCLFDSRSGSAYTECFSNVASSLKPEKPPRVSSSSSLTKRVLTIASILSEQQSEDDADDNFLYSPSQENTGCRSSRISWDEKAEILDSNDLNLVTDETPEMMKMSFVMDGPDKKATDEDQTSGGDFHSNDFEALESVSSLKQQNELEAEQGIKSGPEIGETVVGRELKTDSEHDETESEGDDYVDALNSIESDSENDPALGVSQEVQKNCSEIKNEKDTTQPWPSGQETEQNSNNVEDDRLVDGFTDHCLRTDETTTAALDVGTIERTTCNVLEPASSVNASDEQVPRVSGLDSDINNSASGDSLSGSSNDVHNGLREQESEDETRDDQPIKIWTNGNLLGLEPSKPPVFADPHAINEKSSLSHGLLVNGFRRKDFLVHNRKIVPATIPETNELTEKNEFCGEAIEERKIFKDPFSDDTPFEWLTSSPPLEHMKISFKSADSMQISQLKLKFPDGIQHYGGNKYTFSSFQLVPEPANSLGDTDSDDDTFCRSSHGVSDNDYLSDNCSVSNSEKCEESGSSPIRKDQELYYSLQRNMHAENASEPSSLSSPLPNVPKFKTLKPRFRIETANGPVFYENFSYLQNPAEPLPPPLPPVQWRVAKISTDGFEDKQQSLQDALTCEFEQKGYLSTGSQQSCVASVNKEQTNILPREPIPENNVHQKNNGQEDKQNANVNKTETGDFLHQIRTKQFNLRRTATTKPPAAAATGPTMNFKINAILEKANSIRQAVGSDDGDETDTWSDT